MCLCEREFFSLSRVSVGIIKVMRLFCIYFWFCFNFFCLHFCRLYLNFAPHFIQTGVVRCLFMFLLVCWLCSLTTIAHVRIVWATEAFTQSVRVNSEIRRKQKWETRIFFQMVFHSISNTDENGRRMWDVRMWHIT